MNDTFNFAASPTPAASSAKRKGKKILIVDDEPLVRQFIEAILRSKGYDDLLFCGNGSVVPNLALKEQPHLIIMDVMMPGGNGLRALRSLKSVPITARIPVVLTSGFNFPTLGELQLNRPDGVLTKPFMASELIAKVESLLETATVPSKLPEIRHPATGSRTQPVPV